MIRSRPMERFAVSLLARSRQNLSVGIHKRSFGVAPRFDRRHRASEARRFSERSVRSEPDPYDRYRRPPVGDGASAIIREILAANAKTARALDRNLQKDLIRETKRAIRETVKPSVPECGPTGRCEYESFRDDETGRRLYVRRAVHERGGNDSREENAVATESNSANGFSNSAPSSGLSSSDDEVIFALDADDGSELLAMSLSVDESCVAYLKLDVSNGSTSLFLRHIENGLETKLDVGDRNLANVEWGAIVAEEESSKPFSYRFQSLYYVTCDASGRPDEVRAFVLDSETLRPIQPEPILVYESSDPAVMVDVQRTKGCQYVSVRAMTKTENEIYLSRDPRVEPILVLARQSGMYHVDVGRSMNHGKEDDADVYLLASLGGAEEMSVYKTSVSALPLSLGPESTAGAAIIAGDSDDDHFVSDIDIFSSRVAVYERSRIDGLPRIRILSEGRESETVPLPRSMNKCGKLSAGGNMHYDAERLTFCVETPVTSPSTYCYDFISGQLEHLKNDDGENNERPSPYCFERVMVPSADETLIPMSLVFKRDAVDSNKDLSRESFENDGHTSKSWLSSLWKSETKSHPNLISGPVILTGYGAYGEPVNLGFDPTWIPLIGRGCILAFAHTRGGGELGRQWYHAGRAKNKPNAISDYAACAESLLRGVEIRGSESDADDFGTIRATKLIAKANLAGGVVVCAAWNRHPGLFDGVVLTNAFCDLHATMSNPSLFLTAHEYDEYGNPSEDEEIDKLIRSYCPVSNIRKDDSREKVGNSRGKFLVIAALDDDMVPFWNSVILSKKLTDTGAADALLHIEERGGHDLTRGGRRVEAAAIELSFILGNSS